MKLKINDIEIEMRRAQEPTHEELISCAHYSADVAFDLESEALDIDLTMPEEVFALYKSVKPIDVYGFRVKDMIMFSYDPIGEKCGHAYLDPITMLIRGSVLDEKQTLRLAMSRLNHYMNGMVVEVKRLSDGKSYTCPLIDLRAHIGYLVGKADVNMHSISRDLFPTILD